ncbi:MAG: MFS transporter, partial [Lachnospiraceae bacterium]|nr:MFS transporter [Lachnospiraceae bacterium]
FVVNAGVNAFAATYLLEKGFTTTAIGVILASTSILSCVLQPFLGTFADHRKGFPQPKIMAVLLGLSFLSFFLMQLLSPPLIFFGILYAAGGLMSSATVSLSNAVCAYYSGRGIAVNFGMGAGVGSLSFSFASLGLGILIARLSVDWMIYVSLAFLVIQIILVLGYPKAEGEDRVSEKEEPADISLPAFLRQYRIFTVVCLGMLLLAMCHAMAENYLINLFQRLGGDSENVGTALFIACISAVPFLMLLEKIQTKLRPRTMLRLAGLMYVLKAVLLLVARHPAVVYAAELLQFCTYGFLYPVIYYYVKECVASGDMTKGQAVAVALYTFGLAAGSFLGGRLIDAFGLNIMLLTAAALAGAGALVINLFVGKSRPSGEIPAARENK